MYKAPSMWTYKHKTYWTTRPCQALPSFFAAFSCEASCFCFKTEMTASILDMSKLAELVLDKSDSQPASSSWSMWWSLLHAFIILVRKNWSRESRWKLRSKNWQKQWTKSNMPKVKHRFCKACNLITNPLQSRTFAWCWNEGREDGTEQPQIESNASCYKLTLAFSTFEPHRKEIKPKGKSGNCQAHASAPLFDRRHPAIEPFRV